MKTYKKIFTGELGNRGGNSEVLKKLFWIAPTINSAQELIDSLDTKIKGDFFK